MLNPFDNLYAKCKSNPLSENPPIYLADIELTNQCNLKCQMCPTGLGKLMRPKGFLDFALFKEILWGELKDTKCKGIRFVRWGEPTLHPRFTEFLKESKRAGFLTHFNTNGQLFDEDLVRWILTLETDSIKFSLQGYDKHEYTRIRKGGNFDTVCKWIKYLHDKRGKGRKPYITVDTTVAQRDIEKDRTFIQSFESIADSIGIGETTSFVGDGFARKQRNKTCYEFSKISVNWDGTVSFCCADFDNLLLIGDLKTQSLQEIWNGELAVKYRRMIMNGEGKQLPLCKWCLE